MLILDVLEHQGPASPPNGYGSFDDADDDIGPYDRWAPLDPDLDRGRRGPVERLPEWFKSVIEEQAQLKMTSNNVASPSH